MNRSLKKLRASLAANPNDVKLLTEIAAVYEFELEDYTQAMRYYEKVLAIDSEHILALEALAMLNDKRLHAN